MQKIKVSIVIVHYKDKQALFNCLKSIEDNKPKVSFEVIVVDNDETKVIEDELKSRFNWVVYIKSPSNLGYGAGNNLGAKRAKGEYILFLNPDTQLKPNSVDNLVLFLDKNKDVAVVAPNLIDAKGKVFSQLGSRELTPIRGIFALSFLNKIFPNNPFSRDYYLFDLPMNKKREVDAVPGSAFLIRKKVFVEVGGFDENIFLFFEESDLGRRIKKAGYKLFIIPDSEIFHFWKGKEKASKKIRKIFKQSRFYYFKKHFGFLSAILVEIFARFSKRIFLFFIFFVILVLFLYNLLK
ncbi:MAG: glycosyltransferase family 2 protein [Microgenomates group bacterium]